VEVSPEKEALRVAEIVRDLKRFNVPIGVSVSPFPGVNRMLKDAGADEVKYNLETVDRDLFLRVCPGINFQEIMDALPADNERHLLGYVPESLPVLVADGPAREVTSPRPGFYAQAAILSA
jgi:hypothetical protein